MGSGVDPRDLLINRPTGGNREVAWLYSAGNGPMDMEILNNTLTCRDTPLAVSFIKS